MGPAARKQTLSRKNISPQTDAEKHTRNVFLDRLIGGATTSSGGVAVVHIRVLGCPACRGRWISLGEVNQTDLQRNAHQEGMLGDW